MLHLRSHLPSGATPPQRRPRRRSAGPWIALLIAAGAPLTACVSDSSDDAAADPDRPTTSTPRGSGTADDANSAGTADAADTADPGGELAPEVRAKLDPVLLDVVQQGGSADDELTVIVSLARPADDAMLADLAEAGLTVRSTIGDILTGSIRRDRLPDLAADERVVVIEGSRDLGPGDDPDEPDEPTG